MNKIYSESITNKRLSSLIRAGVSLIAAISSISGGVYAQSMNLGFIDETDAAGFEMAYTNTNPGYQASLGYIDFLLFNQTGTWTWWQDAHNFPVKQMQLDAGNILRIYNPGTGGIVVNPHHSGYYDYGQRISGLSSASVTNGYIDFMQYGSASRGITLGTSSGDVLTIRSSNVGIGTGLSDPTEKLHVNGNLRVTGNIINPMLNSSGSGSTSRLLVGGTVNSGGAWQATTVVGADGQNKVTTGYYGSPINGATIGAMNSTMTAGADLNIAGANLIFRNNEAERMRMNSSGFLGIGTSSPGAKLHISDIDNGAGIRLERTNASQPAVGTIQVMSNNMNIATEGSDDRMVFSPSGTQAMLLNSTVGGRGVRVGSTSSVIGATLEVEGGAKIGASYIGASTAPVNGLLVEGSVGIGSSSAPVAKLDVNGTVRIVGDVTIKNVGATKSVIRISPAGDIPMISSPTGINPNP